MSDKKTYGQIVAEHRSLNLDLEDDTREYTTLKARDLWKDVQEVAYKSRTHTLYANRDFYVVIVHNLEQVGQVARDRVFARRSCPTPTYNQSVFKSHKDGKLEFLWSIPGKIRYYQVLHDKVKELEDTETRDRAKFVILMESGELLEWVKRENGEKIDAVIKINKEH